VVVRQMGNQGRPNKSHYFSDETGAWPMFLGKKTTDKILSFFWILIAVAVAVVMAMKKKFAKKIFIAITTATATSTGTYKNFEIFTKFCPSFFPPLPPHYMHK
jgi:hypothetical protein